MFHSGRFFEYYGHPRRGLGDVYPVIDIGAKGQRELVKQKKLCCEFANLRYSVERGIVPVHVPVQALHDVRERLDVVHFGLVAEPFGERIDRVQIFRIRDAALAPRGQRIFEPVQPGQILRDKIRIGAECVAIVEMMRSVVA